MKTLTAKDAKYGFGRLIDLARAEPVAVAKHLTLAVVAGFVLANCSTSCVGGKEAPTHAH